MPTLNWAGLGWLLVFVWSFMFFLVMIWVAICYLRDPRFSLRYIVRFRLVDAWRMYIRRPVCEVHGRWDDSSAGAGFCEPCLDVHLTETGQDIEDMFR